MLQLRPLAKLLQPNWLHGTFKRDSWAGAACRQQPSPAQPSQAKPSQALPCFPSSTPSTSITKHLLVSSGKGKGKRQEHQSLLVRYGKLFRSMAQERGWYGWCGGGCGRRAWVVPLQAQHWPATYVCCTLRNRRPHPGLYRPNNTRTVVKYPLKMKASAYSPYLLPNARAGILLCLTSAATVRHRCSACVRACMHACGKHDMQRPRVGALHRLRVGALHRLSSGHAAQTKDTSSTSDVQG